MSAITSFREKLEWAPIPQIMTDAANFLKEKGHTCVEIVGMKDYKLNWCEKDQCTTAEAETIEINNERIEFARKLAHEGHKCIF